VIAGLGNLFCHHLAPFTSECWKNSVLLVLTLQGLDEAESVDKVDLGWRLKAHVHLHDDLDSHVESSSSKIVLRLSLAFVGRPNVRSVEALFDHFSVELLDQSHVGVRQVYAALFALVVVVAVFPPVGVVLHRNVGYHVLVADHFSHLISLIIIIV